MTCIVGLKHDGKVYIGGDSAGVNVDALSLTVRADTKVFTLGPYVMGFAGSFRMGQLLHHTLKPTPPPTTRVERHMVATFIPEVQACLKRGKWLLKNDGQSEGGFFLVGVAGRLFGIECDFQVGEARDEYMAIGCGDDLALGSLHGSRGKPPRTRIRSALEAAAYHSAGVTGPFKIEATR